MCSAEGKRELTDDEREWNALTREAEVIMMDIQGQMTDAEMAKHREQVNKGEQLREYLRPDKDAGAKREILLFPASRARQATSPLWCHPALHPRDDSQLSTKVSTFPKLSASLRVLKVTSCGLFL